MGRADPALPSTWTTRVPLSHSWGPRKFDRCRIVETRATSPEPLDEPVVGQELEKHPRTLRARRQLGGHVGGKLERARRRPGPGSGHAPDRGGRLDRSGSRAGPRATSPARLHRCPLPGRRSRGSRAPARTMPEPPCSGLKTKGLHELRLVIKQDHAEDGPAHQVREAEIDEIGADPQPDARDREPIGDEGNQGVMKFLEVPPPPRGVALQSAVDHGLEGAGQVGAVAAERRAGSEAIRARASAASLAWTGGCPVSR